MKEIRKRILTDEHERPIAVQIEYADWVEIERALSFHPEKQTETDLARHAGRVCWPVDGMEYQRQVRGEWA